MTVATIGFNASLWMRHRSMAAARGDWTDADFVDALVARGCSVIEAQAITDALRPFYYAGATPHPDHSLSDDLRIDPDDLADVIEEIVAAAGQRMPTPDASEHVPSLNTVGDLADWLQQRRGSLQVRPVAAL